MSQAYESPAGLTVTTVEIPLTRGYVTRIEEADRVFTDGHNWAAAVVPTRRVVYAVARIDGKSVYMHKLLCPDWNEVDHADGDGLNNCRYNLRDGTGGGNQANRVMQRNNTSGYKGVSLRRGGKWGAFIKVNRKQIYLGAYATPEEAADAYDQAALRYFGEYARTNAELSQATATEADAWQHHPPDERAQRTRCKSGHELTPENTYTAPDGSRECRKCRKKRHAESTERARQRKKAA